MSCCFGKRQPVKKPPLQPQHQIIPEQPKPQVKEDDIITVPKQKRKLFKVRFDLKTVLPQQFAIATWDYQRYDEELMQLQYLHSRQKHQQSTKISNLGYRNQHGKQLVREQTDSRNDNSILNVVSTQNQLMDRSRADRNKKIQEKEISLQVIDEKYEKGRNIEQMVA